MQMNIKSIEKRFVYLSLIIGVLFMVLTPPFQAPDENNHFKKAYVISKGNFFPEIENGKVGFELPKGMVEYIEEQNSKGSNLDAKFKFKDIYMTERLPGEYGGSKFYNFTTVTTNPLAHCVQASGILVGQLLAHVLDVKSPSIVYQLYFARFFNLLFYTLIIAMSIKITPILKKTMALIGLMPMALFQAATVSYDPLLIACSFLALTIIFSISYGEEKKLSLKHIIVLGVIAYVFIVVKIVYLPLYLLLLVLPKKEMKNKKLFLKKILYIFGVVVILMLIFKIATPSMKLVTQTYADVLAKEQLKYVISHPLHYCKIYFNTLIATRQYLIATTIGTFGLIDTNLYCVFLGVYIICMPLIGISEISLDSVQVDIWGRLAVIISVSAAIFGCFLAMYIYWTSTRDGYGIGATEITGVQGRYFIPVIPVCFLVFANKKLSKNEKIEKIMRLFVENAELLAIAMLGVSVIAILLRFWC